MSFFSERTIQKTRKNHVCGWCYEAIPSGSSCKYAAGNGPEGFWSGHTHSECSAAIEEAMKRDKWLREEGYDEGTGARGRIDDDRTAPPQFNPNGTRTEEPL